LSGFSFCGKIGEHGGGLGRWGGGPFPFVGPNVGRRAGPGGGNKKFSFRPKRDNCFNFEGGCLFYFSQFISTGGRLGGRHGKKGEWFFLYQGILFHQTKRGKHFFRVVDFFMPRGFWRILGDGQKSGTGMGGGGAKSWPGSNKN